MLIDLIDETVDLFTFFQNTACQWPYIGQAVEHSISQRPFVRVWSNSFFQRFIPPSYQDNSPNMGYCQ